MTPSKQKTGSKSSGKSKAKPTSAKSGSRGGKTAPKATSKTASKTTSRRGKTPGRKKTSAKQASGNKNVIIAFLLGLVCACALFLILRPEMELQPQSAQTTASAEKKSAAKTHTPKAAKDKTKQDGKSASTKQKVNGKITPVEKEKNGKQTPAAKDQVRKSTPAVKESSPPVSKPFADPNILASSTTSDSQKAIPATQGPASGTKTSAVTSGQAKPEQTQPKAEQTDESGSAVVRALVDLKSLPYEESLKASFEDRVRQVDYALIQAAKSKKLPASSMRQVKVESRVKGNEHYPFQIIEMLPGPSAAPYIASLKKSLNAWGEKTRLRKTDKNQWTVIVDGTQTHIITLYPGRTTFPPEGGKDPAHVPKPTRMRKNGEPARLVIVMDDLGANSSALRQLMSLEYPVTYAFWPHGAYTKEGARAAHAAGHEILVHQPMEPIGYPKVKPGPNVLRVGMGDREIRDIVKATLDAVPHAVGLNNHMGSRFTQHSREVDIVLYVLRDKGLFMLDSVTHGRTVFMNRARDLGLRHYRRNVFLDVDASKAKILAQLRQAEKIALVTGQAVAIGHPLPETLAALKEWQYKRNREVQIVRLRDLDQE